jgi:murein L,D-transpeptidase YafK
LKKLILIVFPLVLLVGCMQPLDIRTSSQSESEISLPITSVVVRKSDRKLYLMNGQNVVRSYRIGLGFSPNGHKTAKGDGKTPEGTYRIDRKNPQSKFHLSLGISYPNAADRAHSKSLGVDPGGDIFIHGEDTKPHFWKRNWTQGCISLKNEQIEEVYALVRIGTPVLIQP